MEAEEVKILDNSLLNSLDDQVNSLVVEGKQFSPLSRREFAERSGVTPAYVGQLVRRLEKVWQPIDPDFIVLTNGDKITSNAQQELLAMIASKPAKYQKRVWGEHGYDPKAKPEKVEQPEVLAPTQSSESSAITLPKAPSSLSKFSQWEKAIATSQSQVEAIDVEFEDSQSSQTSAIDTYSQARERIEQLQAAASRNRETSNATFLNEVAADALKLKSQADQLRELILSGQLDASALAAMGLAERGE